MTFRTTSSGETLHRVPDERAEKIAGVKALCGYLPPFWSRPLDPEQGGPICPDCEESTMITLSDLRALLERALTHDENPAIVRLTERTVEGVARAYLPRVLSIANYVVFDHTAYTDRALDERSSYGCDGIDLTDPGTAHAVVVALALALGLDPGAGGLGVRWWRRPWGWLLEAETERRRFGSVKVADPDNVVAPLVALEPDHIKALCLATRHILEIP